MTAVLGFRLTGSGYSHLIRNLTKSEQTLLKTIFAETDDENKGFLCRRDLKIAMISLLGYKPSKSEANQILEKFGSTYPDGTYTLNLGQFIEAMTPKLINRDGDDEIRQTFMAFDTHCKGFLTMEDLQKVFSQVAPHMGHHRVEWMFRWIEKLFPLFKYPSTPQLQEACGRELDRDGDGRVSYKDFDFMMKYDPLS